MGRCLMYKDDIDIPHVFPLLENNVGLCKCLLHVCVCVVCKIHEYLNNSEILERVKKPRWNNLIDYPK